MRTVAASWIFPVAILLGAAAAEPTADTLFANGDFPGAKSGYAGQVAQNPRDLNALIGLARAAFFENDLDAAEKYANAVLTIDASNATAKHILDGASQRRAILASTTGLTVPTDGVVVPFVESDPLPLVQLAINGRTATLVLDTGAPDVALDPDFAKSAGLTVSGGHTGTFAGGRTAQFQETTIPTVSAGPIKLHDVKAAVMPVPGAEFFKGAHLDGFVGTVFLSRFLATIDYPTHRLILRPRLSDAPHTPSSEIVPFWLVGDHFVFARGSVNGLDALFLVDSGGAGVGFSPEQATIEAAHLRTFPDRADQGVGAGGSVTTIPVVADQLCLGNACQTAVQGLYTPQGSPLKMFPFKAGGIVSHQYLEHYRVTFDFRHMELVLTKP